VSLVVVEEFPACMDGISEYGADVRDVFGEGLGTIMGYGVDSEMDCWYVWSVCVYMRDLTR
jgi:hypothetical protein